MRADPSAHTSAIVHSCPHLSYLNYICNAHRNSGRQRDAHPAASRVPRAYLPTRALISPERMLHGCDEQIQTMKLVGTVNGGSVRDRVETDGGCGNRDDSRTSYRDCESLANIQATRGFQPRVCMCMCERNTWVATRPRFPRTKEKCDRPASRRTAAPLASFSFFSSPMPPFTVR